MRVAVYFAGLAVVGLVACAFSSAFDLSLFAGCVLGFAAGALYGFALAPWAVGRGDRRAPTPAPAYRWEPMQKLNGWHRVSEHGEIVASVRETSGGGWGVWFLAVGLDNRNFITADVARQLVERHYPDAVSA